MSTAVLRRRHIGVLILLATMLAILMTYVVPAMKSQPGDAGSDPASQAQPAVINDDGTLTIPPGGFLDLPTASAGTNRIYNVGLYGITVCQNWTTAYGDGVNGPGTCKDYEPRCILEVNQNSYTKCGWTDTDGAYESSGMWLEVRYHASYSTPWQQICEGGGKGWCKVPDSPTGAWDMRKWNV